MWARAPQKPQNSPAALENDKNETAVNEGRVIPPRTCDMYLSADHLRDQVIRPALEYMGALNPANEAFLLNAAVNPPDVGLFAAKPEGLGIFHITAAQHSDLWDRYLASQRAFLSDPDSELQTNLSYCAAIAWLMQHRAGGVQAQPQSVAEARA
jgi:hypothetical protein